MLVLFTASVMISLGRMSADRLIHDLQHDNHVEHSDASHHHPSPFEDDTDEGLAIGEHQMLHAIDQMQFFSNLSVVGDLTTTLSSIPPLQLSVQSIPLSTFDPPFRPPRCGDLQA